MSGMERLPLWCYRECEELLSETAFALNLEVTHKSALFKSIFHSSNMHDLTYRRVVLKSYETRELSRAIIHINTQVTGRVIVTCAISFISEGTQRMYLTAAKYLSLKVVL